MLRKTDVKYIQSLSLKKVRDQEGMFVAEGPKIVSEFLTSKYFLCKNIYGLKKWFDDNENLLIDFPNENKIEIDEIDLEKISLLKKPNNVVAVFNKKSEAAADLKNCLSLMLYEIQDPGNMGTIIRTADWFGIKNIICSDECVDCYNPKVVQATMGSLARVNIIYTKLEEFINKNKSINLYAAALHGKSIFSINKIKEGIILIGNESKGVSESLLKLCTEIITIPKYGEAESLNAAVACGIVLSYLIN